MADVSPDDRAVASIPAPAHLENHRRERYDGADMGISFASLPDGARVTLRRLYTSLGALLGGLRHALDLPAGDGVAPGGLSNGSPNVHTDAVAETRLDRARDVLLAAAHNSRWRETILLVRSMGPAFPAWDPAALDPRTAQALHDVRGGAFQALALTLELTAAGLDEPNDALRAFYLARDHLKIMRNALPDLDPAAYARDLEHRDHGVQLLLDKWGEGVHRVADGAAVRVVARSGYLGPVSERCIEFSALDRVLYNLMNNAARFAATGVVRLDIAPLAPDAAASSEVPPSDLRFAVSNVLAPAHRDVLARRFRDGLAPLFAGGFTTGGSGIGLSTCAEFVAHAYGLASAEAAVREAYVGATMVEDRFVAWFHWPTVT